MEHALTASELLSAWERGRPQSPVDRALSLLALTDTTAAPETLAQFSIGERDRRLLNLREQLFGSRMIGEAACPACGQRLETTFAVADLQNATAAAFAGSCVEHICGFELHFRLPNSQDLAGVPCGVESVAQKQCLLQSCVLLARRDGEPVVTQELPDEVVSALSNRMAELDPLGDVQLAMNCSECGHQWSAPLDIGSFVWSEIQAWAIRVLREVHALASVYGWREAEILAMTPGRRQAYLELIAP